MKALRYVGAAIAWLSLAFFVFMVGLGAYYIAIDDPDFQLDFGVRATMAVFVLGSYVSLWWALRWTWPPKATWKGWGFAWAWYWWRMHASLQVMVAVATILWVVSLGASTVELVMFLAAAALAGFLATVVVRLRTGIVGPAAEMQRAIGETKPGLEGRLRLEDKPRIEARVKRYKIMQWGILLPFLLVVRGGKEGLKSGALGLGWAHALLFLAGLGIVLFIAARIQLARAQRRLNALEAQELVTLGEEAAQRAPRERVANDWKPPQVHALVGVEGARPLAGMMHGQQDARLVQGVPLGSLVFEGFPQSVPISPAVLQRAFADARRRLQQQGVTDEPRLWLYYGGD